jgi:hypothetical protein
MTRYASWLRCTVQHDFYADGQARGLRFVPHADTQRWLDMHGCICRVTGSELLVAAPLSVVATRAEAALCWSVYADDPQLAAVTEGLDLQPGELLLLAPSGVRDGDAWLHAGDTAGAAEHWPLRWPSVSAGLGAAGHHRPPPMLLTVPAPQAPVHYRARLAARATVWKYWLMGAWAEDGLQVVDTAEERPVRFSAPEQASLRGHGAAWTVRSLAPLALRQRHDARFQLCSGSADARRILVKRLPVAGADHFARETIDSVPTLVSEIYLHR